MQDVYLSDILRSDFQDDPNEEDGLVVPKSFLKMRGNVKFVKKSLVLWSLSRSYERVSPDRLRRFIDMNKKLIKKNDYFFISNFVKMLVGEGRGQSEEFVQVLGFRLLSDSKKEISKSFLPICNEQGNAHKDVGVIGSLYKLKLNDKNEMKLKYVSEIEKPIPFDKFVTHIDPQALYQYLT